MGRRSVKLDVLNSVIDYLWREGQEAKSQNEHEDFSVSLAIVGEIKRGSQTPVESAYFKVCGKSSERFVIYRTQRAVAFQENINRAIPDYDPAEALSVRRRHLDHSTGQGHESGNVSEENEMPQNRDFSGRAW